MAAAVVFAAPTTSAESTAQFVNLPTPWVATDGAVIDFQVLRQGKPFGRHKLTFDRSSDGQLTVTSDVDLDVKVGPISFYKYRLDSTEVWRDGTLIALDGRANNDGRKGRVTARADGELIEVEGTKFDGEVPATIIPSSHWNILQVYGERMLSTETGEIIDIDVENLGRSVVNVGDTSLEATHYRLKSDITVDLWYDDQSRWVKLAFNARGQSIEYVLDSLY